jgi:hypothetical protein
VFLLTKTANVDNLLCIEQQVKQKLLRKIKHELSIEINTKNHFQYQMNQSRLRNMDKWIVRKQKELSQKRKIQKSHNTKVNILAINKAFSIINETSIINIYFEEYYV